MKNKNNLLNIAQLCPSTATLGPGNRFVIWVQGCPFNCKGCIAPKWIPFEKANIIALEDLAKVIVAQENIEGITISGGEPMMQAGRLARLLEMVKKERPELTVMVFSGFTKEQLVWDEALELLAQIDLLIDGNYIEQKNDGKGLRGSSNQQFHFLTNRLSPQQEILTSNRPGLEFHVLDDGVLMTGIPSSTFTW